ncbi:zinc finger, C3HC4 type (RING finger) protein [Medicago truncatula]|uniref:Zinc finger, C3HC4 type (RING finger) protein n=3 Tax=Medicago truncatula TaxID=3880 RepID=G7J8J3_MEDTR|nr:zinc finger, C3HC4 type (RING finger) protein [Medicago truncatula]
MSIDAHFLQVNQNMPTLHSDHVYANTKYNNNQQSDEVDRFLISQNEKLRLLLQEQRRTILKKVEYDVFHILRQKDEQIAQATKKRMELEQFLTRLETENQSWRRAAHENEAMVLSLNNALESIKEIRALVVEDVESCCDQETTGLNMICKCCHSRMSSFMFLPCRHLCSCKACEPSLQACPVCLMPKRSTIETLFL